MRYRPRIVLALLALTSAPLAAGAPQAASPAHPHAGQVHLQVTGLRSAEGLLRVCMTTQPDRFPRCQGDRQAYVRTLPAKTTVTLDFANVAPGRYAIAVLHDENGNGKVDRALGLMPKEGFGFSRDAPVRMGPPSFGQAAFEVSADVSQTIRMRYML